MSDEKSVRTRRQMPTAQLDVDLKDFTALQDEPVWAVGSFFFDAAEPIPCVPNYGGSPTIANLYRDEHWSAFAACRHVVVYDQRQSQLYGREPQYCGYMIRLARSSYVAGLQAVLVEGLAPGKDPAWWLDFLLRTGLGATYHERTPDGCAEVFMLRTECSVPKRSIRMQDGIVISVVLEEAILVTGHRSPGAPDKVIEFSCIRLAEQLKQLQQGELSDLSPTVEQTSTAVDGEVCSDSSPPVLSGTAEAPSSAGTTAIPLDSFRELTIEQMVTRQYATVAAAARRISTSQDDEASGTEEPPAEEPDLMPTTVSPPTPLEAVERYKWSIVPLKIDKKPLVRWKGLQERLPTAEEVREWGKRPELAAWGMVTGEISRRITLDFDGEQGVALMHKWELRPCRRTPSRGYHVDVEYPGFRIKTLNSISDKSLGKHFPGFDIKADGGYAAFRGRAIIKHTNPPQIGDYVTLLEPDTLMEYDSLPRELRDFMREHMIDRQPESHGDTTDKETDADQRSQESTKNKTNANDSSCQVSALVPPSPINRRPAKDIIEMALSKLAKGEGRNNAGFELALQLRDNGYSLGEALSIGGRDYVLRCVGTNTKGESEPYTDDEWEASVRSAYSQPPREPWAAPATREADSQSGRTPLDEPALAATDVSATTALDGWLGGHGIKVYSEKQQRGKTTCEIDCPNHPVEQRGPENRADVIEFPSGNRVYGCRNAGCPWFGISKKHYKQLVRHYEKPKLASPRTAGADPARTDASESSSTAEINWRDALFVTEGRDGSDYPRNILANALIALRYAPEWEGVLAYNDFAGAIVCRRGPPWSPAAPHLEWTDVCDSLVAEWLQKEVPLYVPTSLVSEAVNVVAHENPFHPFREYIAKVKPLWDGVARIDTWLIEYLGCTDTPWVRAVGRRWLISGVARGLRPGCQADYCLMLEGSQGLQKSSALQVLAGDEWFSDRVSHLDSKDAGLDLRGKLIVELGDMSTIRKSQAESIKTFLTRRNDFFRDPYQRRSSNHLRQNIFACTSNLTTPFSDPSGNRRFWPVRCGIIRIDLLARDRDQLWAEAALALEDGEKHWLDTDELNRLAEAEQEERYEPGVYDEMIFDWIEDPHRLTTMEKSGSNEFIEVPVDPWYESTRDKVSISDILIHGLGKDKNRLLQADQNLVARCLQHAKWVRKQDREKPFRGKWFYHRPA